MLTRRTIVASGLVTAVAAFALAHASFAQPSAALQPPNVMNKVEQGGNPGDYAGAVPAAKLLRVPVTGIVPGGIARPTDIVNPLGNDPDVVMRGMRDFETFNCSGCHAANGGGGMGPALSDGSWIYRSSPANIYLDIAQGRAHGMPAWGAMLPDRTIWELVAYIKSISNSPTKDSYGITISKHPQSPAIEQVPAEKVSTPTPWQYTEPFSSGQRP